MGGLTSRWASRMTRWATSAVVVAALLGGCGDDGGGRGSGAGAAGTLEVADGDTIDLFYVQDPLAWDVEVGYGDALGEELGVTVGVSDYGGLRADDALAALRDDPGTWADGARDAEVIVVWARWDDTGTINEFEERCLVPSPEGTAPPTLDDPDLDAYRDALDDLYAEIWRLRDGRPVVLRAVDLGAPWSSAWQSADIADECVASLEAVNRVAHQVAEANGAVVVSYHDVLNGPDHDLDPRAEGWVADDGVHLSDEGVAVVARALLDSGLGLTEAP